MEDLQPFKIKSSIRDYDVSFEDFYESIKNNTKKGDAIIIDKSVYNTGDNNYMKEFLYWLENTDSNEIPGIRTLIIVDSTEENKEYSAIVKYIDELIEGGFRRGNKIIAIGGGVVQDIVGFISSILYRGVEWVFYPTTLLAQGDSCIGGKTSINFGKFKNQIGGFYPPHKIVIDSELLKTLPEEQMLSGYGEMSHYFIIEGGDYLEFFINNWNSVDPKYIIKKSLEIKKKMIEIDEFDKGPRIVFNYGHSFGHAIESITNYKFPHGIAVAHGIDIANYVSFKLGYLDEAEYKYLKEIVKPFFGKEKLEIEDINHYIEVLKTDKKNSNTHLGLILRKDGVTKRVYVKPDEEFKNILNDYFK